jgi:predicted DNA-binding transcriptional regulator YafY
MLTGRGVFDGRNGKSIAFEGEVPMSDEFCRWLLTLGNSVEVLKPKELREKIAGHHRAAAARYDRPPPKSK